MPFWKRNRNQDWSGPEDVERQGHTPESTQVQTERERATRKEIETYCRERFPNDAAGFYQCNYEREEQRQVYAAERYGRDPLSGRPRGAYPPGYGKT